MQIKDKLEVFRRSIIEVAENESDSMLEEYRTSIEEERDNFCKHKQAESEILFQTEETQIRRKLNRRFSEESILQKRKLDECQRETKQKLFAQVALLIEAYKYTEGYNEFLISKVKNALDFAGSEEIIIYLDPADRDKKEMLELETGADLTISEFGFGGGIRAVIRSRNILIDESFCTRIERERSTYTF